MISALDKFVGRLTWKDHGKTMKFWRLCFSCQCEHVHFVPGILFFGHVCVGDCLGCGDVVFKGPCLLRQCLCAASSVTSLQGRVILISCTPTTFLFHGLCNASVVFFVTCYTCFMNLLSEMCMLLRLTSVCICCLKCACF